MIARWLQWHHDWADKAPQLSKIAVSQGRPVPAAAISPTVDEGLALYVRAYLDLQTEISESGAIPFRAIDAYAIRYHIEGWAFERLKRIVSVVAREMKEFFDARLEEERKFKNNG